MKLPTIKDVASKAGVGVGTVSRVLNNSDKVKPATRQRVLDVIEELNYNPNIAARQLSGGQTSTIGVIAPFFTYPSFVERFAGVQSALDDTDYYLALYSIRNRQQLHDRLNLLTSQNRVDGLIIFTLPIPEEDLQKRNPDLPIVMVDHDPLQYYPTVYIDDVVGGQIATEYLIQKGHQSIGFISDVVDEAFSFASSLRRYEGYTNTLQKYKLPLRDEWCAYGDHGDEISREQTRKILQLDNRPTALFVSSDTLAFGAIEAAEDLSLNVPDDIAIIGFDDIRPAYHMKLTTVRQPLFQSGKVAAETLLKWLQEGVPPTQRWNTKLDLEVVERKTV